MIGGRGPLIDAARQHRQTLIARAEHVVVPGASHLMQARDPKGVAAPIVELLSRRSP